MEMSPGRFKRGIERGMIVYVTHGEHQGRTGYVCEAKPIHPKTYLQQWAHDVGSDGWVKILFEDQDGDNPVKVYQIRAREVAQDLKERRSYVRRNRIQDTGQ